MKYFISIMILIFGLSIVPAQKKIDTVYVEKNYSKDLLEYSKFLREETNVHRESIESFYQKITYGIGLIFSLFGAIILWMNWRTKKDIQNQVDDYYKKEVEKIFNAKIQQFEKNLNEYRDKFENQLKEVNKIILDLSRQSTITVSDKHYSKSSISKSKKILWVDDYPQNNVYPMQILKEQGVEFDLALNTKKALELINSNEYDLIISDMGRGDDSTAGLTLLRELHKKNIKVPVIIYASVNAIKKYATQAAELGAVANINGASGLLREIQNYIDLRNTI